MKRLNVCLLTMGIALSISSCGTTAYREKAAAGIETETNEAETNDAAAGAADKTAVETGDETSGSHKILIKLTVDGEEIIIAMYDNTAVDAFLERLPLEDLHFSDLSGIEKPADRPEEPFSLGDEEPGYDPVTGEMVIYRPWGNFTIFYGDFRHSDELVPLGMVERGLEVLESKTDDFTGTLERIE